MSVAVSKVYVEPYGLALYYLLFVLYAQVSFHCSHENHISSHFLSDVPHMKLYSRLQAVWSTKVGTLRNEHSFVVNKNC